MEIGRRGVGAALTGISTSTRFVCGARVVIERERVGATTVLAEGSVTHERAVQSLRILRQPRRLGKARVVVVCARVGAGADQVLARPRRGSHARRPAAGDEVARGAVVAEEPDSGCIDGEHRCRERRLLRCAPDAVRVAPLQACRLSKPTKSWEMSARVCARTPDACISHIIIQVYSGRTSVAKPTPFPAEPLMCVCVFKAPRSRSRSRSALVTPRESRSRLTDTSIVYRSLRQTCFLGTLFTPGLHDGLGSDLIGRCRSFSVEGSKSGKAQQAGSSLWTTRTQTRSDPRAIAPLWSSYLGQPSSPVRQHVDVRSRAGMTPFRPPQPLY